MNKNRLIIALLLVFTMVTLVQSAVYPASETANLTVSCENFSCSTINVTVLYPNHTAFVDNQLMTAGNGYAYYQMTPETVGDYLVYYTDTGNFSSETIEVTTTGTMIDTAQSIIYIGLLGILIFTFVVTIFGIGLLPSQNMVDEENKIMTISYAKYFRMTLCIVAYFLFVAILYASSNIAYAYLGGAELFAQLLFNLFRVCYLVAPVVVIVIAAWILVSFFHDKKFQRLLNRGIFPGKQL